MGAKRLALRMLRTSARACVVALVAFHAWLLASRLASGRPLAAEEAARWVLAAGVLASFLALHRLGVSVLWGRKAIVLWLVAGALHGSIAAPPPEAAELAVSVLPASLGAALFAFAALGMLSAGARRPDPPARGARLLPVSLRALPSAFSAALWSRPPPALA